MNSIVLKENPIGEFFLERPPPEYSEILNRVSEHDRHFIEVCLRGFLYLVLVFLVSSTKFKNKKRGELFSKWLDELREKFGMVVLKDYSGGLFHWKLMPIYSEKIIPEMKIQSLEMANGLIADLLIIMFEILSTKDENERNNRKNLMIQELKDLAEKMKEGNLPPDA